jgi:hypothetical protein
VKRADGLILLEQQKMSREFTGKLQKQTSLFQGEAFWVEFRKRAFAPDVRDTRDPLDPQYYFLDSTITPSVVFPVNAGVVDFDETGNIVDKSRETFNFNSQPYYILEIGSGTKHNYFIILAYNASPRIVHVSSDVPVLSVDEEKGSKNRGSDWIFLLSRS